MNAMTQPLLNDVLLNRELGLLEFNRRVLAQAEDTSLPLLERLKFLCIVSSNLDEFFEVRVAWLKENVQLNPNRVLPDGTTPRQAFAQVAEAAHSLVREQYQILRNVLLPALRAEDIVFL